MMSQINEGENEPLRRNEKIAEPPKLSKFQQLMPQVILVSVSHFTVLISLVSLNLILYNICADIAVIMRCIVLLLHWPNSWIFGTRCAIDS